MAHAKKQIRGQKASHLAKYEHVSALGGSGKKKPAFDPEKKPDKRKSCRRRRDRREDFVVVKDAKGYTVAYIEALPEWERVELLDGELFKMEAPTWTHQDLVGELYFQIRQYLNKKKGSCKVFIAPFGVRIKKDIRNYVEPDVFVVCDREKLAQNGCHGAPDWVIEIVSPSSKEMDYERKLALYREAGMREYWIVDPARKTVTVYRFAEEFVRDFVNDSADELASDSVNDSADKSVRDSAHSSADESACDSAHGSAHKSDLGYSNGYANEFKRNFEPIVYAFTERIKAGIYEDLWIEIPPEEEL